MKVVINKNVLEAMLTSGQHFLDKKDDSQITSHVLFLADGLSMDVKTTDFEMGLVNQTSNLQVLEDGAATANGAKLLSIVKTLKSDDMTLVTTDNFLYIKQGRSKFKLPMFNTEEYPELPTVDNKKKLDIEPVDFLKSLKLILPSVDSNNPKYELNGALIDICEDEIRFVSTDTRRLSIAKIEQSILGEMSLILPKKAVAEIEKLFFDNMEIFYDEHVLICKNDSFTFFTKLMNGKYPNYERIVPESYREELKFSRGEFIEYLKQIMTISQDCKVTFKSNSIIFKSLNEDNTEALIEMSFNGSDNLDISLAINCKNVMDFLKEVKDNEVELFFNDSVMPFTLKSKELTTVLMPLMI